MDLGDRPDGATPAASPEAHAIETRGYAVFPDLLGADDVRRLRAAITELVADIDPPALFAQVDAPLPRPHVRTPVSLTATGLALSRLLSARPDLAPLTISPRVSGAMREVLGADMRLELAGAVVSDRSRPFFPWHTHIDGEAEGTRLRAGAWPDKRHAERVLTLLYLDDLDDDGGPLLVLPRRSGDPTPPPADVSAPEWPSQVELRPRAGTLVALEQCTWHAARPQRRDGLRIFVGCYLAAARAVVPPWADAELMRTPLL